MQGLISDEFYNILSQISDLDYDFEHIMSVFRKEVPPIAKRYGIEYLGANIYEPKNRSGEMSMTKREIYNSGNTAEMNEQVLVFPIGNGGRAEVVAGITKGKEWTPELLRDNYVISRMIYLLTGRANTMARLSYLTYNDQLTGIPNERSLTQFMGKTLGQGRFTAYCTNFVNIKNMKLVNNRFGNPIGDTILMGYAKKMSDFAAKQGEGVAARLGGDNFFVFIIAEKEAEFLDFLRGMTVTCELPNKDKVDVKVDSRVGYCYINEGDGINDVKRNADIAAKIAKKSNTPDFIQFEESMKTQMLKMKQLEQSIPGAIENKEFVVYYQPKADISNPSTLIMNGGEALVRWRKGNEMISPAEFIPLLEKSGLVMLIDYYVLEQVCVDINDWIAKGIEPVKISSNFSRRHLQDPEFADKVERIIRKHNVDPRYIEIEITESYEDEDMQALTVFEKRMHEIGVDLSVDDFGSGFSSIKMIKNIVADTIKLDKSIIDGIGEGNADDVIVSHIIQMINCLGKKIIAEGVETEKQAEFLRNNGCNNIQGFLFAKPCPKDMFEEFFVKTL